MHRLKLLLPLILPFALHAESPVILREMPSISTAADGGLQPARGVHNIQVYRANRSRPTHADGVSDTYLHAPMLAYWKGRFHLDYLHAPMSEHEPPTPTSYTRSTDGVHWEPPRTLFPGYELPDGSWTLTHQRMSFYVAPSDRLLATAFYGEAPSPNDGTGIGRVVREIHKDGSFGPIYFIRYNSHPEWDPAKAAIFPFYTESADEGFIEACEALLDDPLKTAQWWEEDRSEDGFYPVKGKAMSTFTRADGRVIGLWKDAQVGYSEDGGETWTRTGFSKGFPVSSSKYWGERTADGRYAIVFNPTSRLRHPLAIVTSDDGQHFGDMLYVHGELPVQRFPGLYKNMGPQYVRGISEGNGNPPGDELWLTYSVNKEDIWVSRVPVPVTGQDEGGDIQEDFSGTPAGEMPADWNLYRPVWAPVEVVDAGDERGNVLELQDHDPYDYASATRVFTPQRSVLIRFKLWTGQIHQRLEVDVVSPDGLRPVQIAFTEEGRIEAKHEGIWKPAGPYEAETWTEVELDVNPRNNTERFQLRINGEERLYRIAYFSDLVDAVQRLTFRSGEYRRRGGGGHELPEADIPAPNATFRIDDVRIQLRD